MAHLIEGQPGPIRLYPDLGDAIAFEYFYYGPEPDEQCPKHPTSPFETKTHRCRDCLAQSDWSRQQ